MISCTEFIPLYSELFKYIEKQEGKEGVTKYWEYISDEYIGPSLGEAVKKKGLLGCFEYWSKSLNEESCDFVMTYDEDNNVFCIDMKKCPSKSMLNALKHMEPYHDYCRHCEVIYKRQIEKYGIIEDGSDFTRTDAAMCRLRFKLK